MNINPHFMKHFIKLALILMVVASQISITAGQTPQFTTAHTISDGAQGNTIAFDGLAFLTGNYCACTFIPPGKVADYFGFQYIRDNDITSMGHTTDFLTVLANNLLSVLDANQKAAIITLAKAQVAKINQYGYARFPLITAFVRLRDKDMPFGSTGLDKDSIINYSKQLYKIDATISIQRAQLYSSIIRAFTASQRHYLDSIKTLGMGHMPVLPDQIDKRGLNNSEFVAVMSFAGDIYTWYVGSLDADVYFCPERQGNYFGGFYIKDAPAMGVHGYSIDTALTQTGGLRFVRALNSTQAQLITSLVDSQRTALYALVDRRTEISNLLRGYLTNSSVDTNSIVNLSVAYGALDGEISYYYATNFSKVGWSLTTAQKDTLNRIRNLDKYPCNGTYLYSDSIGMPNVGNTDYLFKAGAVNTVNTTQFVMNSYPNPFSSSTTIYFNLTENATIDLQIFDISGKLIKTLASNASFSEGGHTITWNGTANNGTSLASGLYFCKLTSKINKGVAKIIFVR